jgi:hypothetical protein
MYKNFNFNGLPLFQENLSNSISSVHMFVGFSPINNVNESCAKCLVDIVKGLGKGNCPLNDVSVVVLSLPIFNILKSAFMDAGFRARETYKPGGRIHSRDVIPRSKHPAPCHNCQNQRKGTTGEKNPRYPDSKVECCDICSEKFVNPKTLHKCGHVFCTRCIDRHLLYHPKCPTCGKTYETDKGDQPFGTMEIRKDPNKLPGHAQSNGTIVITYTFKEGYQMVCIV